jgi:hypothetical protein
MLAVALAAELKPLSHIQALDLLALIAEHEPATYDAAAARWHARWECEGARVGTCQALPSPSRRSDR